MPCAFAACVVRKSVEPKAERGPLLSEWCGQWPTVADVSRRRAGQLTVQALVPQSPLDPADCKTSENDLQPSHRHVARGYRLDPPIFDIEDEDADACLAGPALNLGRRLRW